jgi:hypothetical protein
MANKKGHMMSYDNPFEEQKTAEMPIAKLARALKVSRNTLYRWSNGPLDGMPRIVLLALKEGKITFQDIERYGKVLVTLKRLMSDASLEEKAAAAPGSAPGAPAPRETYVMHGIEYYSDTHEVVPTANPLAGWRK